MEPIEKKFDVFGWGLGFEGQLGINSSLNEDTPKLLKNFSKVKITAISTGGQFSSAVSVDGDIYCWGSNKKNQLGLDSDQKDYYLPVKIPYLKLITSVSCGDWHSLCLDRNLEVFSVGYNKNGCLATGNFTNLKTFQKIQNLSNIKVIHAGRNISFFINSKEEIFSSGISSLHGNPNSNDQEFPIEIKSLIGEKIVNVTGGYSSCACINSEGKAFSWGNNECYQLGHGNKLFVKEPKLINNLIDKKIIQISSTKGNKHCHMGCIDSQGFVYTWGSGYKGKLGHGKNLTQNDTEDEKFPKRINFLKDIKIKKFIAGGIHSAVISEKGLIYTFGCGSDGRLGHPEKGNHRYLYKEREPKIIESLKNSHIVIDASSSYYHMIALCQNN